MRYETLITVKSWFTTRQKSHQDLVDWNFIIFLIFRIDLCLSKCLLTKHNLLFNDNLPWVSYIQPWYANRYRREYLRSAIVPNHKPVPATTQLVTIAWSLDIQFLLRFSKFSIEQSKSFVFNFSQSTSQTINYNGIFSFRKSIHPNVKSTFL